jgi:hypothetical protein
MIEKNRCILASKITTYMWNVFIIYISIYVIWINVIYYIIFEKDIFVQYIRYLYQKSMAVNYQINDVDILKK